MGIIFIKNGNFEIKIESQLFINNGTEVILDPPLAKLIDDLTDKFGITNQMKTKKLYAGRNS